MARIAGVDLPKNERVGDWSYTHIWYWKGVIE